jgi:flavorubredoxin
MQGRTAEIADGIYQIATLVPEINLGFNQYLIAGDEPMLFHTGMRGLFPLVSGAVSAVVPAESMRWIAFGHVEADECGAMNEWLALAPAAQVTQGMTGCMVSLNDLCDRPPAPMPDRDTRDIGGHVVQWFDTPHLPHGWEAGVLYDTTTKTLFCGDLFTLLGAYEPTSDADIVGPSGVAEDIFHSMCLAPDSAAQIRRLAELEVTTLALMHGPAFTGDCRGALLDLADDVDKRISAAAPA